MTIFFTIPLWKSALFFAGGSAAFVWACGTVASAFGEVFGRMRR